METPDDINRREAMRGLMNLALLEGAVLIAVVGIYFYTQNLTHLIGGVVGTAIIFGPLFLRWFNAHGKALKAKPNSDTTSN